jgi:hypothetical protein
MQVDFGISRSGTFGKEKFKDFFISKNDDENGQLG